MNRGQFVLFSKCNEFGLHLHYELLNARIQNSVYCVRDDLGRMFYSNNLDHPKRFIQKLLR